MKKKAAKPKSKNFTKLLNGLEKKLIETQKDFHALMLEWASSLGFEEIKMSSREEYDDNNYYRSYFIDQLVIDGNNLCEIEMESHHLDEDMGMAEEAIKEIPNPNSRRFIMGDKTKTPYAHVLAEDVEDMTLGPLTLHFMKQDKLEDLKAFLYQVTTSEGKYLPNEWSE